VIRVDPERPKSDSRRRVGAVLDRCYPRVVRAASRIRSTVLAALERRLRRVLRNARPGSEEALSYSSTMRAVEKGLGPATRGFFLRWRLGHVSGPVFFLGKSVRLVRPRHLFVGRAVFIGDGCYIDAFSLHGVWLGDRVTLREHSWLQCTSSSDHPGEGLTVGGSTYFGPGSYLGVGGRVTIGTRCQFGPGLRLVAESHNFRDGSQPIHGQGVSRQGIRIGDDCWFGANVIILDGITIGSGVVVGANSLVTSDLEDRAIAYGSPARVEGFRRA
jgi:acetyltransferase-like isoleucine patch superfamily enzyme